MNLKIEKLDDFGRGITYIDGKVTFVKNAVIGDIVEVVITKSKKKYNEAIIKKVIKPSDKRVKPMCPYFNECGGCVLQNLNYDDGLLFKKEKVINYFKKNNLDINPLVIKCNKYNYRNKITLKIVNGNIGYYESNSHKIIPILKCEIAYKKINDTISLIKGFNILNGEVIIRCNYKEEILIAITSNDKVNIDYDNLDESIVGIILNDKTIYKDNYFYEKVNNLVYKVSYNSFFQVNVEVAKELFSLVDKNIYENDYVLDLYSGVGTFSLNCSKAKKVYGVEIVENAILNALENALLNHKDNVEFILSDASKIVDIDFEFNKLIVDPPRAGLSKEVINFINEKLPEKIIYISCDYHTQVRDINLLPDYKITKSYVCDMFPYTYHVECVSVLHRKSLEK